VEGDGAVYLTRDRLTEIERELRELKIHGRKRIADRIAEARAHGDLSENSEYDAALEEQGHLERKIFQMENMLSRARIIDPKDLPNDRVYILSRVRLKNLKNGEEVEYLMVSPEEADFDQNKISVTSPLGKGLLRRKLGEQVKIKVPAGFLEYEIIGLSR